MVTIAIAVSYLVLLCFLMSSRSLERNVLHRLGNVIFILEVFRLQREDLTIVKTNQAVEKLFFGSTGF